uniref:Ionotropic glutamate receptor L-glutamate and glycine-binding domain-containing protein n=1 Tax=Strigamia maritima TaxID=126957 RepID=T1JJP7_STRMM
MSNKASILESVSMVGIIQNDTENQYLERECSPRITLNQLNESVLLGGYFGQVFNFFNIKFNISFKITQNEQFGAFKNGSWTGMIGDLTYGVSDICADISMTSHRGDYVNFSPAFYPNYVVIIHRKLDYHEWNYTFYGQPYNKEMWLCVLGISLVVILLKVLENYVLRRKHFGSWVTNFINKVLLCWPIVLQGFNVNFSSKSLKLIFGIYVAFSMMLLICYNSELTSLLATTHTEIPFTSLEDMIETTNYLPVILKGTSTEDIFLKTPFNNTNVFRATTFIEGIEKTYGGKFGCVTAWKNFIHLFGSNCSFAIAEHSVRTEFISLGYSKQFANKDFFNYKILLLKQYGILSAEYKRFFPDKHGCVENQFNPVSFGYIIGPFIFLMSAILLSLIFGMFELIMMNLFYV